MKLRNSFLRSWLLVFVLLVACASSNESAWNTNMMLGDSPSQASRELAADTVVYASGSAEVEAERVIIRSASLEIVVDKTEEKVQAIMKMAEEMGGWIVQSEMTQYDENSRSAQITIRIPVAKFEEATTQIKQLAQEVRRESISGKDVTTEYVDLSSRLRNLQLTKDRLEQFLAETKKTSDALSINKELTSIQEQIELLQGQIKNISESADYSAISVNLMPSSANQPIKIAGWSPTGVARDAIEDLISVFQLFATFLIWFVIYWLPILAIIGGGIWLVWVGIGLYLRKFRGNRPMLTSAPTNQKPTSAE